MIPYTQCKGKRDLSPWCPSLVSIPGTWHQGCTAWAAAPVQGISPLPKIPLALPGWAPASGRHPELCSSKVRKMVPQALSASRKCRDQSTLISSLGILSLTALIKSLQFLLVKTLLIPAKPAACRTLASDHFPARRWLCGHVPKSTVPWGHGSSQGSPSPGALICWPVIFTCLNGNE